MSATGEKLAAPEPWSIYPATFDQWIAFAALLMPIIIGAVALALSGWEKRMTRRSAEWDRVHELAGMLHNVNEMGSTRHGEWEQVVAIREITSYRTQRGAVLTILRDASDKWKQSKLLEPEIEAAIARLGG